MQSTGQARAHLSHPMHVVRSNRWNPRYRGRTGTGFSGYSKYWVNAFRRNDSTKYHRVTYMPWAIVLVARPTFRNQVRIGRSGSFPRIREWGDCTNTVFPNATVPAVRSRF